MKKMLPMGGLLLMMACEQTPKTPQVIEVAYPQTPKNEMSDTFFGEVVPNPYGWLEDDRSTETANWVKAQNEVTFGYLNQIPYRSSLKQRLEKVWNYEKIGSPFKEGDFTYYYKNDGLQNQSVLYRKDKDGKEEVFLNPNEFSKDGTTSLGGIHFSKDGSLVAYLISEGGSDWRKLIVWDAVSKKQIGDTLVDIKFSGTAWKGNEGFFYSSYDKPKGSELSAKTDTHKLYYHKLGTSQKEDILIFGGSEAQKYRYVGGSVSDDARYLFISAANTTSGNKLFIKDLVKNTPLLTVADDFTSDIDPVHTEGDVAYLSTNRNAPNSRLVAVKIATPSPENWKDIIPETENVLSVGHAGKYFFANYIKDAVSLIKQYDVQGNFIREIQLPSVGTASGFYGKATDTELYYSFANYFTPNQIFRLDIESGKSELYWSPKISFNPEDYESKQVFYTSKDGKTKVPMIITHKKGIKLDGTNPTFLYGYGGFNASLTPSFSIANAIWLEQGGVYAVANLRGGGEYGKKWHDAGTKMQKQNVFDDFIAAAEYLISEKYTSSQKLAIRGGSNGGLLVGATLTQRPDLMKVAIPEVGVLDMLRYHKFTAGAGWAYDYGTADDSPEMFAYLKKYSPVHNVKQNVCYPATMVTTGDHDDRVVPAHSFKFAAELQAKQACKLPTLIRIDVNAGHGAGTPVAKVIDRTADIFAFTLWNMGYQALPVEVK